MNEQYFYEIVPHGNNTYALYGPLDGIRETTVDTRENGGKTLDGTEYPKGTYYVKILDGKIVAAFMKKQILVLNKKLGE